MYPPTTHSPHLREELKAIDADRGLVAITMGVVEFDVYRKRPRAPPQAKERKRTKVMAGSLWLIIPFVY